MPIVRLLPHLAALLLASGITLPGHAQEADDALGALLAARGVVPAPAEVAVSAAGDLVIAALNFLDVRYHRGGSSVSDGFDCSGFTRHVVSSVLGITLPRRSAEQAQRAGLPPVARQALQPGDLVFFNTLKRTFSHVGIYIGDGRFVHAPRSGQQVRVERMDTPYWAKRFDGARRVTAPSGS